MHRYRGPRRPWRWQLSTFSLASSSISSASRILSGSVPSTSICSAFWANGSGSGLQRRLKAEQALLAGRLAPFNHLRDEFSVLFHGRLEDPGTIFQARMKVAFGVWIRIEANVPRNTMVKASPLISEPTPAPLRMLPTTIATNASMNPPTLSASIGVSCSAKSSCNRFPQCYGVADAVPSTASCTRARTRASAWPWIWQTRDSVTQDLADLPEIQLLIVVERHHQGLALRQGLDRRGNGFAKFLGLELRRRLGVGGLQSGRAGQSPSSPSWSRLKVRCAAAEVTRRK